jgi:hypothetical protein
MNGEPRSSDGGINYPGGYPPASTVIKLKICPFSQKVNDESGGSSLNGKLFRRVIPSTCGSTRRAGEKTGMNPTLFRVWPSTPKPFGEFCIGVADLYRLTGVKGDWIGVLRHVCGANEHA